MNTHNRITAGIVALLAAGVGCWMFWPSPTRREAGAFSTAPVASSAQQDPTSPQHLKQEANDRSTGRSSWVNDAQLESHFDFDTRTITEITDQLRLVRRAFVERKGINARVISQMGATLELEIPGLVLSQSEVDGFVSQALLTEVSSDVTRKLLSDPLGQQWIRERLRLDLLGADVTYSFKRTTEEDSAKEGLAGLARFSLQYRLKSAQGAPQLSQPSIGFATDFTVANLSEPKYLGWNAISKAPAGYFSRNPIGGIESHPSNARYVMVDEDSGKVAMYNLGGDGKKEVIDLKSR